MAPFVLGSLPFYTIIWTQLGLRFLTLYIPLRSYKTLIEPPEENEAMYLYIPLRSYKTKQLIKLLESTKNFISHYVHIKLINVDEILATYADLYIPLRSYKTFRVPGPGHDICPVFISHYVHIKLFFKTLLYTSNLLYIPLRSYKTNSDTIRFCHA